MRKYIITLFIGIACPFFSFAQSTWYKEWFKQKSTQREYLAEQIAALKLYSGYLKKGYDIYKKGHNAIGNFKRGEFNLHNDFFISLKSINPEVAKYSRVGDIIQLQIRIVAVSRKTLQEIKKEEFIPHEELAHIIKVYSNVLNDCSAIISDLAELTTSGKLEMNDDERLQRIDLIYGEIKDAYNFTEVFSNDVLQLSKARKKEQADIHTIKGLNGK